MYNYNTYIYYMYSYPIYDLDRATVSDGIGLFGETLEELFITGPCNQYTSLNILLGLLPALTHLTIKLTYSSDEAFLKGTNPLMKQYNGISSQKTTITTRCTTLFSYHWIVILLEPFMSNR